MSNIAYDVLVTIFMCCFNLIKFIVSCATVIVMIALIINITPYVIGLIVIIIENIIALAIISPIILISICVNNFFAICAIGIVYMFVKPYFI